MMKFRGKNLIGAIAVIALLSGCGQTQDAVVSEQETAAEEATHEHTWVEATCTEPKTCSECGETEGVALGHDWVEATCEAPKACARCGETEGEALEHEWTYATIDAPKTCINCGATEGSAVSVMEVDLSEYNDNWSLVRPVPDSISCEKVDYDAWCIVVHIYDYDGNLIKEINKDLVYDQCSYGVGIPYIFNKGEKIGFMLSIKGDGEETGEIEMYSPLGERLSHYNVPWTPSGNNGHLSMINSTDPKYHVCYLTPEMKPAYYVDTETQELFDASLFDYDLWWGEVEYDESKYTSCSELKGEGVSGYLVSDLDGRWGYADSDFNEIAMYVDASGFNTYGYALVTEDGNSFDIIDSEFNIVAKDYIQGKGAYVVGGYGPVIGVRMGDDHTNDVFLYITGDN